MKKSERIFEEMKKIQLIALLTPKTKEECLSAYEFFRQYGIILEIAFRSDYAFEGIKAICDKYPDALVLAGTVMTSKQAEQAIKAGAAGIVSADYIPAVVDLCIKKDVMCVPGGLADAGKQLVQKAEGYGLTLDELRKKCPYQWVYKLFPAFSGKLSNLDLSQSWKGPFKDLTVIYTGGITLETIEEALAKDPKGIFCASALTKNIGELNKMKEEADKWKALLKKQSYLPEKPSPEKLANNIPLNRVTTFGELMIRLSPPPGVRLRHTRNFELNFGGAEANVAIDLAQFGVDASFVTVLAENDLGDNALSTLRMFGVDTRFILRRGKRMGIYYLEHGFGPRPSNVVYDRAHSAFSEIKPGDLDWAKVLNKARWFHWTGITPALGDSVCACLKQGLELARKKGITVSVDLNYRKNLWKEEKAKEIMTGLMPFVDILIGNEEDPIRIFGIEVRGTDISSGKLNIEGYKELTKKLVKRFNLKKAAISLRQSLSASENFWSACLFDGRKFYQSPRYHLWILDRVGTGDAFAAGLIYGILKGKTDQEALNFAVASACLKHSVQGDFNLASVQEVERFAAGETSGRVQR
jgi:2-dehydro-3-deoxygluconokinase